MGNDPAHAPEVSIVVISRNRPAVLRHHLPFLKSEVAASGRDAEILVVEENDVPQTAPPGVRYLALAPFGQGFGVARNEGLDQARGRIIVFVDDDIRVSDGWLATLLKPFENPDVGAVGGAVLPEPDSLTAVGGAIGLLGFPAGGLARVSAAGGKARDSELISTGNCAVRRDAADIAGGFDPLLRWGGEDQEFFHRVSQTAKTVFEPRAVVWHRQRNSLGRVWRWAMRRGRAEFGMALKARNAWAAATMPFRANFLLKIMALIVLMGGVGTVSPIAAGLGGLAAVVGWLWAIDRRCISAIGSPDAIEDAFLRTLARRLVSPTTRRWLPAVRWCMDAGREAGRWQALARYLWCRWVDKPMILTFHHLERPPASTAPDARRYFYDPDQFSQFTRDAAADGRLFVGVPDILHRLRQMPRTLFAEPLVALTFDDAYVSACRSLQDSPVAVRRASIVFAPTASLGQTNFWDSGPGWPQVPVADRASLLALSEAGVAIGAHTRTHADLIHCGPEAYGNEIDGPLADLRSWTATDRRPVFSYPYGRCNPDVAQRVQEAGYAGAVANFIGGIHGDVDRFQLPRFPVDHSDTWVDVRRRARRRCGREGLKAVRSALRRMVQRFRKGMP